MTRTRTAAIRARIGRVACAAGVQSTGDTVSRDDPHLPSADVPRGFPGPSDA